MNQPRETVVVTGSSGLIGSALAKRLAEQYRVVGFDRDGPPHPPPEAECICVDLTSDESVRVALERVRNGYGQRIASVIHLAAYYDFSGAPSSKYEEVTVQGTGRLLHGLNDFQFGQFVFSSTMLVHAPAEPGRTITEVSPLDPTWDYPRSKARTEELILREQGEIPAVILRIAGVYDDLCHSIPLAHQIQRIYERWAISRVFPGDTARGQAFVHLDDVVDAIARAVDRRSRLPAQTTILIGEPKTLSYDEIQRAFARLIHGEEWETRQIPKAVAKAGAWVQNHLPFVGESFIKPWMIDRADDHYELDITRARTLFGWTPKRSLRESLPEMIAALTNDPAGWYRENKLHPPARLEESARSREETVHAGSA